MGMYKRSHSSFNDSCVVMISKPPKPPCWRDFLPEAKPASRKHHIDFADLSLLNNGLTSDAKEADNKSGAFITLTRSQVSLHSSKTHKKIKNKLHRTRSQSAIQHSELPECKDMTLSLADTKPKDLLRKNVFDARVYLDENTKRCERWLEEVRASAPLDDVAFAQGSGDELEIPEENWEDMERLKPSITYNVLDSNVDSVSMCRECPNSSRNAAPTKPLKSCLHKTGSKRNKAADTTSHLRMDTGRHRIGSKQNATTSKEPLPVDKKKDIELKLNQTDSDDILLQYYIPALVRSKTPSGGYVSQKIKIPEKQKPKSPI